MSTYISPKVQIAKLICTLLLIGYFQGLTAQINTNKIRVDLTSLSFNACSDANNGLSTMTIQSKQASTNTLRIAFDLPDGIAYQAGTAQITGMIGSNDFVLAEVDISDLNAPIFSLERSGNANWQINDQVTFTYAKTGDCDAVQFSYGGGLFKDAHAVSFEDAQGTQTATDNDLTINSYNLRSAFLSIGAIPAATPNPGDQVSRTIIIENSGNGHLSEFTHEVTLSGADLEASYAYTSTEPY